MSALAPLPVASMKNALQPDNFNEAQEDEVATALHAELVDRVLRNNNPVDASGSGSSSSVVISDAQWTQGPLSGHQLVLRNVNQQEMTKGHRKCYQNKGKFSLRPSLNLCLRFSLLFHTQVMPAGFRMWPTMARTCVSPKLSDDCVTKRTPQPHWICVLSSIRQCGRPSTWATCPAPLSGSLRTC